MTDRDPYRVEEDTPGCAACQHGLTWIVIGPDDVGLGTTYQQQGDAIDMAHELNNAYHHGQHDVFHKIVRRREGPEDRRRNGTNPAKAPADGERRAIANGRRNGDDGMPF